MGTTERQDRVSYISGHDERWRRRQIRFSVVALAAIGVSVSYLEISAHRFNWWLAATAAFVFTTYAMSVVVLFFYSSRLRLYYWVAARLGAEPDEDDLR